MKIGARPLATATALLFLFGVVGLLVVDDDASSTRLTAAAAATTAQGTARMSMTITIDVGGGQTSLGGEGVVDMGANRGRLTFTSPGLPGPMEVIIDGTTAYVATVVPQVRAQAEGKPWAAFDASKAGTAVGGDLFGGGTDPMQSLRLLREKGMAGEVRENGTQDVRGAPTTRFVAELDVARMFEALDSPQAKALEALARDAEGEIEVWVGEDDVVRRSVVRVTLKTAGQAISTTVTTELFDFGVPVEVTPPPADQVHRLQG